jgi:23S rRNA-/tRNA-specific pseudouridylate synthase
MSGQARWVVKPGDGARSVADVLARLGEGAAGAASAAEEGRAFVNGRRAAAGDAVAPGDEVVIWSAREAAQSGQGRAGGGEGGERGEGDSVRVIDRWGEIVAAYKPANLPTTPDRRGERSLVVDLAKLLGVTGKGGALPHAASRLDVGVSGVVLCALGHRGQAHIEATRERQELRRTYVAIAAGPLEGAGTWSAPIGRQRGAGGRMKPSLTGHDMQAATTRFRAVAWARPCAPARSQPSPSASQPARSTLLLAEPVTGRMHQIRVHAAGAGAPLVGDREHGGPRSITDASGRVHAVHRIGLHALAVELLGPRGEALRAIADVPADFRQLWKALDGPDEAWNEILEPRITGRAP